MSEANKVEFCDCNMRKKIAIAIIGVLPEEVCGVPDKELADFMRFDLAGPNNEPVLQIRFCPWCSHPVAKEERITHVSFDEESNEGEEWKNNGEGEDEDWRGTSGG